MSIPVFYSTQGVVAESQGASPSAGKPSLVLASWQDYGHPIEIRSVTPATVQEIKLAHDADFVDGILSCKNVNGFGNRSPKIAASLPWTSGSLLSAARFVLREGALLAVSPTSGFHHACWAEAQGFCTFNGLMITVLSLRQDGFQGKIGILDLDEHYGNGTVDIAQKVGETNIHHYTFGGEDIKKGEDWLKTLPGILQEFMGCDLILYQAGADPHENDPYSRGLMSNEQLYRRDLEVFRFAFANKIPLVWNLAGGYQTPIRKVLSIHDNTMNACVETYLP